MTKTRKIRIMDLSGAGPTAVSRIKQVFFEPVNNFV